MLLKVFPPTSLLWSTNLLHRLSSGSVLEQFVHNQATEIRELVPVTCWRHCAGVENPADIPSRGLTPLELSTNRLWHCGPEWLVKETNEQLPARSEMPEGCLLEMRLKDRRTLTLLVDEVDAGLGSIIECQDYSSVIHLFTVTAYVMRFV